MKEIMEENIEEIDLNENDLNINNINNINIINNIIISPISDKEEINEGNEIKIQIGPRIKHQKKNKTEDIELQIACEDSEERKERLMLEKQKKKEKALKNKNLIYKIDEDNYNCVDCGNTHSSFISINNGVTICSKCAEIHKTLGHCVSYLLNINDELDEYLFNFIVFGSNTKFKRFLKEENFDKNLSIKKKYRTNVVVFYRRNLKNKVEGKQLEKKDYQNPNDICEDIYTKEFNVFDEYIIKKRLIKNGELIKENKFMNFMNKIFFSNKKVQKKNKVMIRKKSTVKEKLFQDMEVYENKNKNNLNINMKKYKNALDFENDKIKESSRPLADEKTEPDNKTGEREENPTGIYTTSEQIVNNSNKAEKDK